MGTSSLAGCTKMWAPRACRWFQLPRSMIPNACPSSSHQHALDNPTPVTSMAVQEQQAFAFFAPGPILSTVT